MFVFLLFLCLPRVLSSPSFPATPISPTELRDCLADKRIAFVGNSVTRARAFSLHHLLAFDVPNKNREEQKNFCGKSGANAFEGEVCRLYAGGTHIEFQWVWAVYNEIVENLLRSPDFDYILFNAGSHYIFTNVADKFDRAAQEADMLTSRTADISRQKLWYFTTTRLCDQGMAEKEKEIETMNEVLQNKFFAAGINIFDAWTSNDTCIAWDDHTHSERMARAHVMVWANRVCGSFDRFASTAALHTP